ncbi:unnamed protein product [Cercopithifilaria johnstoni]|uniref:Uncharacterized protein n=1 Tax=Cercopithifilaria johnstoni TaxID=2874296 RepID=A0A8J2Q7W8_9BILA|nr:unnamed protein product [Cercopithifilaria johnstoni]
MLDYGKSSGMSAVSGKKFFDEKNEVWLEKNLIYLGTRNNAKIYVIDLPPRYSEVEPPPYDWALKYCYLEDYSSKIHMTLNLSTAMIICSCLVLS